MARSPFIDLFFFLAATTTITAIVFLASKCQGTNTCLSSTLGQAGLALLIVSLVFWALLLWLHLRGGRRDGTAKTPQDVELDLWQLPVGRVEVPDVATRRDLLGEMFGVEVLRGMKSAQVIRVLAA